MLSVNQLHVKYNQVHAVKGISFTVAKGEMITLIGSNGAGKTSILSAITGLVPKAGGEVLYRGGADSVERPITHLKTSEIVRLGIVHIPEGRRIFSELTVEENLRAGFYVCQDVALYRQKIDEAYTLFPRLAERRTQKGGTLSGGEQQMLAIARGLMNDPELVILDEPSLGLAPIVVEQIFDLLQTMNQMGKTILLVEQNAYMALQIAQRGYVLETGQIVTEGDSATLLHDPMIMQAYLGLHQNNEGGMYHDHSK